jgi:hypothetical protein
MYRRLRLNFSPQALTGCTLRFFAPEVSVAIPVGVGTHLHAELTLLRLFWHPPLR